VSFFVAKKKKKECAAKDMWCVVWIVSMLFIIDWQIDDDDDPI